MTNQTPFKVEESKVGLRNAYRVTLEGDVGNVDTITTINTYDKKEFEEKIAYAIAFALDHLDENVEIGEYSNLPNGLWYYTLVKPEGEEEFFEDPVFVLCDMPEDEYRICHTLLSVEVLYYDDDCRCYRVDNESIKEVCKYEYNIDPEFEY